MSLLQALELIRERLPQEIQDEVKRRSSSALSNANEISFKGFSLSHVENPRNLKHIIERRLKTSPNHNIERRLEEELSFLNESFSKSTEDHLWSGYAVINEVYSSYIVDVGRQAALKIDNPDYKHPFQ
jgi:hypothetical protein